MESKEIEQDLDRLDEAVIRLKRDYEIYFSGGAKLPPRDAHRRLEREIRNFSRVTGLTLAQKFRYNNISARYNSYVDLWNKQMRIKEEGRTPSGGLIGEKPKVVTQNREAESSENHFQKLYNDYVKCRQQTGEGEGSLSFERFSQQIVKQKEMIRSKYHCKDVEFAVKVEEGRTRLKARPVK